MGVFRGRLSICVCASFPFGFACGMWDLIVLIPDHCLSINLLNWHRDPGKQIKIKIREIFTERVAKQVNIRTSCTSLFI